MLFEPKFQGEHKYKHFKLVISEERTIFQIRIFFFHLDFILKPFCNDQEVVYAMYMI